jgi:hypothetical protein
LSADGSGHHAELLVPAAALGWWKVSRAPNRCLAGFVAPRSGPGAKPYTIGLFAVTAGLAVKKKERQFIADHDDYSAILLNALADRPFEAFAERLHQRLRTEFSGYAPDEALSNEVLIAEQYLGIRPAPPGHPACPDHRVKQQMSVVLEAGEIGMGLTQSLAMTPAPAAAAATSRTPRRPTSTSGASATTRSPTERGAWGWRRCRRARAWRRWCNDAARAENPLDLSRRHTCAASPAARAPTQPRGWMMDY